MYQAIVPQHVAAPTFTGMASTTHLAYVSLGSNLGDREAQLHAAVDRLANLGRVTATSSIYETEPVELTSQPWFLNSVVSLATKETVQDLLHQLLAIERDLGRDRLLSPKKGPRVIDIDILLFDDLILQSPSLTIPHPAMHQRRFVLEPLAEIAPSARHPILEKSVEEMLADLPPGQVVRRLSNLTIPRSDRH
ncbi:MAG TPA: 2-amino-4-hydroxy-6-hydroxymethyldihydropteridine diphosphokinase [Candidatus Sulfotelmatobacter sp.]|nr:2-amino-4-hydroxy-6-hydroxymethyldihydropteridine diphosphokinase [Candidatus Sulfotelmatobacter sp.]